MLIKYLTGTARNLWCRQYNPKTISPSATRFGFTGIVGEQSQKGKLLSAGPMMEIMDSIGAAVGNRFTQGPIATVSFDRVDTVQPILHGDMVRVEGEVISVGNSSLSIQCSGYRLDRESGMYQQTHGGVMTMVAVNRLGQPRKGLPKLVDEKRPQYINHLRAIADKRRGLTAKWTKDQEAIDKQAFISQHDLQPVDQKAAYSSIKDAELEQRNFFLPKSFNTNETVFGGNILAWMDEAAVYCARNFTGNDRMISIGAHRVLFEQPITGADVVTLKARVCHVRRSRLDVELDVFIMPILNSTIINLILATSRS
ncbi:hypothetical protein Poli38472_010602 [Pythium oligandrum]|uniref:HotDog ACOT-type domain-containing protein n=1 Tax=Pythium oligandrum TaxID=41045 RepID=A0A8K1C3E1_PYTOL|nr:hypothetical protein Poli38472_010602 [Pythium oligandrum]|eukprot:TMW55720.1 hypothetical protein Poli38472_010602 [Pythium oligandrum]